MDLKDLKELIAFDQAQFQEVIKVHDLKEQAILEFEKEKQEMYQCVWCKAKDDEMKLHKELEDKIKNEEELAREVFDKRMNEMDKFYLDNKDKWLSELLENCIK